MNNVVLKYFVNALILILLQVLVFNQIVLHVGSIALVPYIYILSVLLLPLDTPREVVVLVSFLVGLAVDFLSGSVAVHTAALVLVGFLRAPVLNSIAPRMGYNQGTYLSYLFYGWGWFLKYVLLIVLIHHFWLFLWEIFSLKAIVLILLKTVLNGLYSTIFIVVLHLIFKNRPVVA